MVGKAIPKLLVVTSFTKGLNLHLASALINAFDTYKDFIKAELKDVRKVLESDTLKDYDLFLYFGSSINENNALSTLSLRAKLYNVPSLFWATEDPYEFDARYVADYFDIYFSNDQSASMHFFENTNVHHLPLAASIETSYRPIVPVKKKQYGIYFCGVPFKNRKIIIQDILSQSGLHPSELVVVGPNWDIPSLNIYSDFLDYNQHIDMLKKSIFCLNLGRDVHIANNHRKLISTSPGPRTFECALAGTPQFCMGLSAEIGNYYNIDEEIIFLDSIEELSSRYLWFSNNHTAWERLAYKQQKRTMEDHLYQNRILFILSVAKNAGMVGLSINDMEKRRKEYVQKQLQKSMGLALRT